MPHTSVTCALAWDFFHLESHFPICLLNKRLLFLSRPCSKLFTSVTFSHPLGCNLSPIYTFTALSISYSISYFNYTIYYLMPEEFTSLSSPLKHEFWRTGLVSSLTVSPTWWLAYGRCSVNICCMELNRGREYLTACYTCPLGYSSYPKLSISENKLTGHLGGSES